MKQRFNIICAVAVAAYFFTMLSFAKAQPANDYGSAKTAPKAVGVSAAGLKLLQQKMQSYVDGNKLAGLVTLIASRSEIVHFEKYGIRDIEGKRPMQENTIFRLASMTKPFTSTAIMMLYEQGPAEIR